MLLYTRPCIFCGAQHFILTAFIHMVSCRPPKHTSSSKTHTHPYHPHPASRPHHPLIYSPISSHHPLIPSASHPHHPLIYSPISSPSASHPHQRLIVSACSARGWTHRPRPYRSRSRHFRLPPFQSQKPPVPRRSHHAADDYDSHVFNSRWIDLGELSVKHGRSEC